MSGMPTLDAVKRAAESGRKFAAWQQRVETTTDALFGAVSGIPIDEQNIKKVEKLLDTFLEKHDQINEREHSEVGIAKSEASHLRKTIKQVQRAIEDIDAGLNGGRPPIPPRIGSSGRILTPARPAIPATPAGSVSKMLNQRNKLEQQKMQLLQQEAEAKKKQSLAESKYAGGVPERKAIKAELLGQYDHFSDVLSASAYLKLQPKEITKTEKPVGRWSRGAVEVEDIQEDFFSGAPWSNSAGAPTTFSSRNIKPDNLDITVDPATGNVSIRKRRGKKLPEKVTLDIVANLPMNFSTGTPPRNAQATHTKTYTINLGKDADESTPEGKEKKEKRKGLWRRARSTAAHATAGALTMTAGKGLVAGITAASGVYAVADGVWGSYKGRHKEAYDKSNGRNYPRYILKDGLTRTVSMPFKVVNSLYNKTARGAWNFYGGGVKKMVKGESFRQSIGPAVREYMQTSFAGIGKYTPGTGPSA